MDHGINLRLLSAFQAVMKTRSVTKAAGILHLSQPTVSQQVARLEEDLGVSLFHRVRGQVQPTAEAWALIEEVDRALGSVGRVLNAAANMRRAVRGTLRVAASTDHARTIVAEAVERFSRTHSEVRFSIITDNPVKVTEQVAQRKADVGISRWSVEQEGCDASLLYESPFACLVPRSHALSRRRVLTPADLENEPLAVVCRRPESRMRIEQVFRDHDARIRIQFEIQTAEVGGAIAARGLGILLYDSLICSYFSGPDVAVVPFRPALIRKCVIITPKDYANSSLSNAFIGELKKVVGRNSRGRAWPGLHKKGAIPRGGSGRGRFSIRVESRPAR